MKGRLKDELKRKKERNYKEKIERKKNKWWCMQLDKIASNYTFSFPSEYFPFLMLSFLS